MRVESTHLFPMSFLSMRPDISGAFLNRSSGSHDADLATTDEGLFPPLCWGLKRHVDLGQGEVWEIRERQPPRDATGLLGDTTECISLYDADGPVRFPQCVRAR